MRKLTNKKYVAFDYLSRYTTVPFYFDVKNKREVAGVGLQLSRNTPYVSHKVKPEDTLDSISLSYYNNPTYWWAIAYFNGIIDPFEPLIKIYTVLKIPSISNLEFKDLRY